MGRIPEIHGYVLYIFLGLIASVAVYDVASRRTLHLATIIGASVLLALNLSEELIGNTQAWLSVSHRMLGI